MKKMLICKKAKIMPQEVVDEINKFKEVTKSPYSQSYYNTPNITWEHKPEGSLRISDHWNFESRGEKHCELDNIQGYIENNWILAQYLNGKYHVLKEFGPNTDGYIFITLLKNDIELAKKLYEVGGIVKTNEWYRKNKTRPILAKESHTKNSRVVAKYISAERMKKFKDEKTKAKKIIFLEDEYMDTLKRALYLYKQIDKLNELTKTDEGIEELHSYYGAYEFVEGYKESRLEIITLVLDNNLAIDFKIKENNIIPEITIT